MKKISKNENGKRNYLSKKCAVCALMGLFFVLFAFILFFFNPLLLLANYELRVENGSILFEIMSEEMEAAKLHIYLFNYTNMEQFLSGEDENLKLKEVGPFVYQEYRTNEDLEMIPELNEMQFTPHYRPQFVLEESIGRPEDVELFLPNIPYLTTLAMIGKLPGIVRYGYRIAVLGLNLRPVPKTTVHDFFWNVEDPYVGVINKVMPGLMYYNNSGLLTRFYDVDVNYRIHTSTLESEKFQMKSVERYQYNKETKQKNNVDVTSYTDAYEGAAFPPNLTPSTPINIYRYGICKLLSLEYNTTITTEYGLDAFEYVLGKESFARNTLCDRKGCPYGISDLSECYMGFPFALSKGHFLDADPRLLDRIEGLSPNRAVHDCKLYLDPKIGIALDSKLSTQFSLALGDMSVLHSTRRLSDMYLPVTHCITTHPKFPRKVKTLFSIYNHSPAIIYTSQAFYFLLGLALLLYSRKVYYDQSTKEKIELCSNLDSKILKIGNCEKSLKDNF